MADFGLCAVCGAHATRLCDAVLGFHAKFATEPHAVGTDPRRVVDLHRDHPTCDAPLCDDHVVQVGRICGHDAADRPWMDSIDYCPVHADPAFPRGVQLIRAVEAEAERDRVWARLAEARPPVATLIPFPRSPP